VAKCKAGLAKLQVVDSHLGDKRSPFVKNCCFIWKAKEINQPRVQFVLQQGWCTYNSNLDTDA